MKMINYHFNKGLITPIKILLALGLFLLMFFAFSSHVDSKTATRVFADDSADMAYDDCSDDDSDVLPQSDDGGTGGGRPERIVNVTDPRNLNSYCLEYVSNRDLTFSDIFPNQSWANEINFLKNVRKKGTEQYVVSGEGSLENATGVMPFNPTADINVLAATKSTLLANCIAIYQELPEGEECNTLARKSYPNDSIMDFVTRVYYTGIDNHVITCDNHFRDSLSKGEAIRMLVTTFGIYDKLPVDLLDEPIFMDVGPDDPNYEYIQYAAVYGIINTDSDYFYPDRTMQRHEFFSLIVKILTYTADNTLIDIIKGFLQ